MNRDQYNTLITKKLYAQAIEIIQPEIAAGTRDFAAYQQLSECYFLTGDYAQARAQARTAAELGGAFRGKRLIEFGIMDVDYSAENVLKDFTLLRSLNRDQYKSVVASLIERCGENLAPKRQHALKKHALQNLNNPYANLLLGILLLHSDPDIAQQYFTHAAELDRPNSTTHSAELITKSPEFINAANLAKKGDYRAALEQFKAMEKRHPEIINIRLNIVYCFLELGEHEKALQQIEKIQIPGRHHDKLDDIHARLILLLKHDTNPFHERINANRDRLLKYTQRKSELALYEGDWKSAINIFAPFLAGTYKIFNED